LTQSAITIGLEVGFKSSPEVETLDDSPQLTIGEVARKAGVAPSAIRYYERIGVLPRPDRVHGQRRYEPEVLGTLTFVGVAQDAGFKLEEIKDLLRGLDGTDGLGETLRALSGRKLTEVDELLERANAMRSWLTVANACDCETPAECVLFPAPGEGEPVTLRLVRVEGRDCRRES
jgi:MerR family redox-sensitive transcriptional activator SoxR